MSLFIEVYVGSKNNRVLVADIVAHNVSNLADTSDYKFTANEKGNKYLDIPKSDWSGFVEQHYRNQSVWPLVRKMVDQIS